MALTATARGGIPVSTDWDRVALVKRNSFGDIIKSRGKPIRFTYHRENSTGDIYGANAKEGIDSPLVISAKAFGIFLATPLYTLGMMTVALIRIAVNSSAIFWRTLPQLIRNIPIRGPIQSLANLVLQIGFELPLEIAKDLWRIVRAPLYGFGIMMASLIALPCPFEGRKWIGKIERDWHEGLKCNMDIRYGLTQKEFKDRPLSEDISEVRAGKIYLLGYCMQVRGNINDKVAGRPRFEIFEQYAQQYAQKNKPKELTGLDWLWAKIAS